MNATPARVERVQCVFILDFGDSSFYRMPDRLGNGHSIDCLGLILLIAWYIFIYLRLLKQL